MIERRDFDHRLRELHRQYAKELPQWINDIRRLWQTLEAGDDAVRPDLLRLVHRLGGSGATFGFPEITHLARRLEELLDTGPDTVLPVNEVEATLEALERQMPASG